MNSQGWWYPASLYWQVAGSYRSVCVSWRKAAIPTFASADKPANGIPESTMYLLTMKDRLRLISIRELEIGTVRVGCLLVLLLPLLLMLVLTFSLLHS